MCSIGEDDFGDEGGTHAMVLNQKEQLTDTGNQLSQCKKCNAENVSVYKLYFRDFECRDCFLSNARHKFRATLGSSKILPRDAKVLLIFDGTAEAVVLLDMLYHALTQNNFKRLHCTSTVLFIDETVLDDKEEKSKHVILSVHQHLKQYIGLKSFIAPITSTSESPCTEVELYLKRKEQNEVDFMKRIAAIRTLTSRQDFIKYQRKILINNAAKQLNCNYVFQPEISTTLATQLLTAIALGRGGSAAYDVALVENRLDENVKVIRPLRDLSQPEIELYMRVQHFLPLKTKADEYGASRGASASLQNLTSAFVENLQQNYSSTVSTVFRSCDKIAPKRQLNHQMSSLSIDESDNQQVCSFCCSPIEGSSCNTATLLAIEFSRLVSQTGSQCVNTRTDLDSVARKNLAHINDKRILCHACRNIEKDSNIDLFGT